MSGGLMARDDSRTPMTFTTTSDGNIRITNDETGDSIRCAPTHDAVRDALDIMRGPVSGQK